MVMGNMKMCIRDRICGLCFNDTGLLFVFGLFGVQSLPYGREHGNRLSTSKYPVSYTHLDVYKRQGLLDIRTKRITTTSVTKSDRE